MPGSGGGGGGTRKEGQRRTEERRAGKTGKTKKKEEIFWRNRPAEKENGKRNRGWKIGVSQQETVNNQVSKADN